MPLPARLVAPLLALLVSTAGLAQLPGELDPSFYADGGRLDLPHLLRDLATRPDGNVLGVGSDGDEIAITRLDGASLNHVFRGSGYPQSSAIDDGHAVAVQPDGKTIVAAISRASNGTTGVLVLRLATNLALDPSFSGDGRQLLVSFPLAASWSVATVADVALQPDGRILVVGSLVDEVGGDREWFVGRLTSAGGVDTTFNPLPDPAYYPSAPGFRVLHYDEAARVVVTPAGKILVGGTTRGAGLDTAWRVVQLNADGTTDVTWGTFGSVAIDPDAGGSLRDRLRGMALAADRGLYLAGEVEVETNVYDGWLVKLDSRGALDLDFAEDGTVELDLGSTTLVRDLLVVPGLPEWILVAGGNGRAAVVAAWHGDGTPRTDFGDQGVARFDLDNVRGVTGWSATALSLAVRGAWLDQAVVAIEARGPGLLPERRWRVLGVRLE